LKQYREQIVGRRALTLTDANQSARMGEIQHLFADALVGTEPAKIYLAEIARLFFQTVGLPLGQSV